MAGSDFYCTIIKHLNFKQFRYNVFFFTLLQIFNYKTILEVKANINIDIKA